MMEKMKKVYIGKPIAIKTRQELLATVRPNQRGFLRADAGDLPDAPIPPPGSTMSEMRRSA
jgi:hypothetical protein